MFDAEHLRERGARLLAMALKAREAGDDEAAEDFTERATQLLGEAEGMAGRFTRNPRSSLELPAQQQQQPQPDSDKDED